MKKRILSLFLSFVLCIMPFSVAFASSMSSIFASGTGTAGATLPTEVNTAAANVFAAIKAVAMIAGVFILVYFGIKYFTAGATEKAKTKEMMVPFIIGSVILVLAPQIIDWLFGFTK